MKPEEEEPCSSSSVVTAPGVSPESPPSLKPVVSSVLDRALTCVWGTSLWFPFLTCSWQFFFFLTKYVRFSWRAQTAVILWKSLRKLGMVCSLKAGGNYLLKPSEPRGCVVGRFSIIASICLVALELCFFLFLFVIWLYLKKNSSVSSKLNLLVHTLFSFWCLQVLRWHPSFFILALVISVFSPALGGF